LDQGLTSEGHADIAAEYGRAYASSGWKGVLRKKVERCSDPKKKGLYDPFGVAEAYVKLGDNDKAFLWLDKTYAEQIPMSFLMVDPDLDKLRSDPRYTDLVHRIGFPQ
jgi:hypothetical protein